MQPFLWNSSSLQAALSGGCVLHGQCFGNRICIDSRTALPSDIFGALKGEHTDGHHYIAAAFKAGASCAIVERIPEECKDAGNFIVVPNVQDAIKSLAIFNRSRFKGVILAVTGSVGKTSTKEALEIACSAGGSSFCSKGNFNNQLGAPISLASMPLNSKYAIFELGMNHAGEIEALTAIVKPHLAIITAIENTHIEHFSSVKGIAAAKAEIFSSMDANGVAIINGDTPYYDLLASAARAVGMTKIYSFGKQSSNDCYLIDLFRNSTAAVNLYVDSVRESSCTQKYTAVLCSESPSNSLAAANFERGLINYDSGEHHQIKARIFEREVSYAIRAHGQHQAMNSMSALAAAYVMGVDLELAARALIAFTNVAGRGKVSNLRIDGKNVCIIDDSYNASPASVVQALAMMSEMNSTNILRKVAVLGDMYELGTIAEAEHAALVEPLRASTVDKLVAVGPLMKSLFERVPLKQQLKYFETYKEAKDNLPSLLEDGDCVLLKGSHGTKVYEIVKHLQTLAS